MISNHWKGSGELMKPNLWGAFWNQPAYPTALHSGLCYGIGCLMTNFKHFTRWLIKSFKIAAPSGNKISPTIRVRNRVTSDWMTPGTSSYAVSPLGALKGMYRAHDEQAVPLISSLRLNPLRPTREVWSPADRLVSFHLLYCPPLKTWHCCS